MTMAGDAASVLGMSEEVINRFLFLVDALEKNVPEGLRRADDFPSDCTERLEALIQEYDARI